MDRWIIKEKVERKPRELWRLEMLARVQIQSRRQDKWSKLDFNDLLFW